MISWKIAVGDLSGELEYIAPDQMSKARISIDGSGVWIGHPKYGTNFCVRTLFAPDRDGRQKGKIIISGFNGKKFLEEVRFPVIRCPYSEKTKLLDGAMDLGLIIRDPWLLEDCKENEFKCCSIPLFALLYPDGKGMYLDFRSEDHSPKKVLFNPDRKKGTAELSMSFFIGNGKTPVMGWEMPGECVFGEFAGSWYEAAQIYKEYAVTRSEFTSRRGTNPLRQIGLWVWNRGNIADVIPPLKALQDELPGIPLALDWYWWHHNPYDTNYPNFWPPREGEEAFRTAVADLRARGIYVQVYLNGVCWDMDDPSFAEDGMKGAVICRNGEVKNNIFNSYTRHRLAWMCSCSHSFQDRLAEQVKNLRKCGLSGQYLDMISGFSNELCYSSDHNHVRGGGSSMADGYRHFIKRLKAENPNYPLTSEGCGEIFMDLLDGVIVCNSSSVEHFGSSNLVIPVFPAVYHGPQAMALFGNYALPDGIPPWDSLWPQKDRWKEEKPWHRLYPEQFYIDVIRNVVFGTQPMICNLTSRIHEDPEYSEIWKFIIETAKFYYANRDFLFDGQMLNPADFECSECKVSFMQRMIFTKADDFKTVTVEMPSLLHGIWQAQDGRVALFIGNYGSGKQGWRYRNLEGFIPGHSYCRIDLPSISESNIAGQTSNTIREENSVSNRI